MLRWRRLLPIILLALLVPACTVPPSITEAPALAPAATAPSSSAVPATVVSPVSARPTTSPSATARAAPTTLPRDEFTVLRRRPLALAALPSGAGCPVSTPLPAPAVPEFATARVLGHDPVYATGFTLDQDANLSEPRNGWRLAKVLWWNVPAYRGPLLIRGRRLDGPGVSRFRRYIDAATPSNELALPADVSGTSETAGMRHWGGYVELQELGCYGFQIDGLGFSHTLIVRATHNQLGFLQKPNNEDSSAPCAQNRCSAPTSSADLRRKRCLDHRAGSDSVPE